MNIEINNIYNMDCREGISYINFGIDLVVTSPPYNVNLGDNKYNKRPYDLYKDNVEHKEYISFLKEVFALTYDKLVSGGRVCINIGDGKNGAVPTSSDIIQFMCDIKYIPMAHIIWDKGNSANRCAWGSFCSPSSPSFPTPFEHVLVFAKESRKLTRKGNTDITKKEFIEWSSALWKFKPENRQKKFGHPAMFPEELPKRCIKMLSLTDSIVMDPFCGAGTTPYVAKLLNRSYVAFDISAEYVDKAIGRVNSLNLF